MKNRISILTASVAFLLTASSFSFGPVDDVTFQNEAAVQNEETQQKEKRVKVIVHKDGTTTKIDTVFTGEAIPSADAKIDSMLLELHLQEPGSSEDHLIFFDDRGRSIRQSHALGSDSMLVRKLGSDSTRKFFEKRMVHHDSKGNRMMFTIHRDSAVRMIPPVPPVPGPVPMMFHRQFRDTFAFDPNDENIISYDRKDIGKGLEKIVIVRKKVKDVKKIEEFDVEINDMSGAE